VGGSDGDALSINVLSAVAQLAREEGRMLDNVQEDDGGLSVVCCLLLVVGLGVVAGDCGIWFGGAGRSNLRC